MIYRGELNPSEVITTFTIPKLPGIVFRLGRREDKLVMHCVEEGKQEATKRGKKCNGREA